MNEHRDNPTPDPELVPDLGPDLARLVASRIEVPRRVDDAVMSAARSALSQPRRTGHPAFRLAGLTAAAAGLGLALWLGVFLTNTPSAHQADTAAAIPGDLDGNGRLTILDAFTLARKLDSGVLDLTADFNGDGRIDRADVDAIATAAVRLPQEKS